MAARKPATCLRCGQTWPREPALEVPCPTCFVPVGQNCRRPSGHPIPGDRIHHDRDRAAMDAGLLQRCPGGRR